MDTWDKTKTDLIKKLAADDMSIDNLLANLSVFAGMFSSEQAEYGLKFTDFMYICWQIVTPVLSYVLWN